MSEKEIWLMLFTGTRSDNGLAPNMQRIIIYPNAGFVYWCIYASFSLSELGEKWWKIFQDPGMNLKNSPGPVFCLLLGVSSDYAQPITGYWSNLPCDGMSTAWAYSK